MKETVSCRGIHCPIRNQCLRYNEVRYDIRKCRNQSLYVQNVEKINGDSLRM